MIATNTKDKKGPAHIGAIRPYAAKTVNLFCMLLFLAGIIGMLLPSQGAGEPGPRLIDQMGVPAHIVVFFLGGHLLYLAVPTLSGRPMRKQVLFLIAAAFLAGALIEAIQSMIPGRFISAKDIAANMTGVLAYLSFRNLRSIRKHALVHISAACLIGILLWPLARALTDEAIAHRQFPLLAGFETPFEATRFIPVSSSFHTSREYALHGNSSLKVNLTTSTYSGISLARMPGNWEGYASMHIALYNPRKQSVQVRVRIHDEQHATINKMPYADRFNRAFTLPPESWTTLEIPLSHVKAAPQNRQTDMTRISNLQVFVAKTPEPFSLYVDDIRLIK